MPGLATWTAALPGRETYETTRPKFFSFFGPPMQCGHQKAVTIFGLFFGASIFANAFVVTSLAVTAPQRLRRRNKARKWQPQRETFAPPWGFGFTLPSRSICRFRSFLQHIAYLYIIAPFHATTLRAPGSTPNSSPVLGQHFPHRIIHLRVHQEQTRHPAGYNSLPLPPADA